MKKAAIIDDNIPIFNRWVKKNPGWDLQHYLDINDFLDQPNLEFDAIIVDYDLGYETSLGCSFGMKVRNKGFKNHLILSTVHSGEIVSQYKDLKNFDHLHKKLSFNFDLAQIIQNLSL